MVHVFTCECQTFEILLLIKLRGYSWEGCNKIYYLFIVSLSGSPETNVIIFHLQVKHLNCPPSGAVICCTWEQMSSFRVRMEE